MKKQIFEYLKKSFIFKYRKKEILNINICCYLKRSYSVIQTGATINITENFPYLWYVKK